MELKINSCEDRKNTVVALAQAGYWVKVEERRSGHAERDYFVQFEEQSTD